MRHDAYGLPVTTSSSGALETYDRAVEGLLGWDARALDFFRDAAASDPTLAQRYLEARLHRRPDHYWKTRVGTTSAAGLN